MTETVWGEFPLELDSELLFLGAMMGIIISIFVAFIVGLIYLQFFKYRDLRHDRKIRKHMRKYHPKD